MKYRIKKYTAIAAWHWNIPDSENRTCRICHQDFDNTCAKCRVPGDECPIIFGKCKHYFHLHCIHTWNDAQNRPTCPLCRAPWEIDAYAGKNQVETQELDNGSGGPTVEQNTRNRINTAAELSRSNTQTNVNGVYVEPDTVFPDEATPDSSTSSGW